MSNKLFTNSASLLACGSLVLTLGLFRAQSQENEAERDWAPNGSVLSDSQRTGVTV